MDVFRERDYKVAIKKLVNERKKHKRGFNLRVVAEKIPVQYTYLSKCLNQEGADLSDDHVFVIGEILGLNQREMDFLLLLRTFATTRSTSRKKDVERRIDRIRAEYNLSASLRTSTQYEVPTEIQYLTDPLAPIVHVACFVPAFGEDIRQLCGVLGITWARLEGILLTLQRMGLVSLSADRKKITDSSYGHIHYSPEHPLLRAFQGLMRQSGAGQFHRLTDEERYGFVVAFAANPSVFEKVREDFREYIRTIEKLALPAEKKNVYQLNFDVFKWI